MKRALCALAVLSLPLFNACAPSTSELMKRAEINVIHNRNEAALEQLDQAVENDPKSAPPLQARSDLNLRMNRRQQAIADLGKIIELNPQSVQPYMSRGLIYSSDGLNDKALQDFRKACELGYDAGCVFSRELEKNNVNILKNY